MIKLVFSLRRRPEITREEFQAYWRERHAPLVSHHAAALRIRRYVQTHARSSELAAEQSAARGSEPDAYDGQAELWWDSLEDVVAAASTPAGRQAAIELLEDERGFIDLERSPLWIGEEHVVVERDLMGAADASATLRRKTSSGACVAAKPAKLLSSPPGPMDLTDVHPGPDPVMHEGVPGSSSCQAAGQEHPAFPETELRTRGQSAFWREAIARYEQADVRRSAVDVATSLVAYLALCVAMYFLLEVSYLLVLVVAVPASGFLLRTYIVFHDCTHGSFLPSKRANTWLGMTCGLFVYSPFEAWKHEHAIHHATSSDLDRRGIGDVDTLTVSEYRSSSLGTRLGYRLMRNPLVMLGLGPIWALAIQPRFSQGSGRSRDRRSVIYTDLALVLLIGGVIWAIGWRDYLLLQLPTVMLAGAAGVFMFYVQHQFEDAHWTRRDEWSYADAALRGSSHLRLPKVLQFFSGNIGLHHVHHLSARIPNYKLQQAHDENEFFHSAPTLSLWDGINALRLKLWDEDRARLVTFAQARKPSGADANL